MTSDMMEKELLEPTTATRPDVLVSAVLHLMSHYSASAKDANCTRLASVIERHLKALSELPDLAPVLQATCRQLSEQWATVVERSMPRPAMRSSLLGRLVAGAR